MLPAAYRPGDQVSRRRRGPARCVGARAALGAEHAGVDAGGVERRRVERAEGGLRPVAQLRVAPPAVVLALAATEVGVLAVGGLLVEPARPSPRMPRPARRSSRASSAIVGASIEPVRRRPSSPLNPARPYRGQVVAVEDQPGWVIDVVVGGHVDRVEGRAERVVVRRLVGEAPAQLVDHDRVRAGALAVDLPGGHACR